MTCTIAYISDCRLRLKQSNGEPRTVESRYGETIKQRVLKGRQRNAWKTNSRSNTFLYGEALWGGVAKDVNAVPMNITSICRGQEPGQFLYSLQSDSLCGILRVENHGEEEKRLWNKHDQRVRFLDVGTDGRIACSLENKLGTADIGIMSTEGGLREITEGDSLDTAPRWVIGSSSRLVFQSAGIGRDREGHMAGVGPFCVESLDLETGDMSTLIQDPSKDFLTPHMDASQTLYCIRRPYRTGPEVKPLQLAKDVLLFPFRMIYAVFEFFSVFSQFFTGKKLTTTTAGGARQKQMPSYMVIWGNYIDAQQGGENKTGDDLVPSSWELIRIKYGQKPEVLATNVLSFDLSPEGDIVYTNGSSIFHLSPDGKKEKLVKDTMVEQVVFLPKAAAVA
ncbi:MAG: hypothetical protein K0Q55_875 [Verrucomicrobia bacterium]|jgi:hypothetical protein|nr:hypothetical protein [Verrucomicrobiota bacterium]